jgi:hypothetical protein
VHPWLMPKTRNHVYYAIEGTEILVLTVWGAPRESISGHLTDRMREHCSTVHPVEQRESIGAVLRLVKGGAVIDGPTSRGTHGGTQGPASRTSERHTG